MFDIEIVSHTRGEASTGFILDEPALARRWACWRRQPSLRATTASHRGASTSTAKCSPARFFKSGLPGARSPHLSPPPQVSLETCRRRHGAARFRLREVLELAQFMPERAGGSPHLGRPYISRSIKLGIPCALVYPDRLHIETRPINGRHRRAFAAVQLVLTPVVARANRDQWSSQYSSGATQTAWFDSVGFRFRAKLSHANSVHVYTGQPRRSGAAERSKHDSGGSARRGGACEHRRPVPQRITSVLTPRLPTSP